MVGGYDYAYLGRVINTLALAVLPCVFLVRVRVFPNLLFRCKQGADRMCVAVVTDTMYSVPVHVRTRAV